MEEEKIIAETEEVSPAETEEVKEEPLHNEEDPVGKELDKIKKKGEGRSKKEKLLFTKKRIEEQLKELGEDIEPNEEDDNTPVTVGYLKKLEMEKAEKTALQLADEISDEKERELTIYHLKNSIKSQGNPSEDLKKALALVNSVKNTLISEELARKTPSKTHSTGSSQPTKVEEEFVLTEEEKTFMAFSPSLTIEDIKAIRRKSQN